MAAWTEPDWWLGRSFSTEFKVLEIGPVPASGQRLDRLVRISMRGEVYEISLGELTVLFERGFVVEGTQTWRRERG